MNKKMMAPLLIVVIALAGCGSAEYPSDETQPESEPHDSLPADFAVRLERTACRGVCPVYHLTVNAEGHVVFRGDDHVAAPGVHRDTMNIETLRELEKAVLASDFFNLSECYCDERFFDVPTSAITVTMNGASHTVRHLKGNDAPPEYLELEEMIDRLCQSERWIKGE